MSTCEVFELPELELEPYELREALRCVLHTVLFQRALGLARPRDVPSELFEGVSYATVGDAAGEELVEERIAKCCKAFEQTVAKLARVRTLRARAREPEREPECVCVRACACARARVCVRLPHARLDRTHRR